MVTLRLRGRAVLPEPLDSLGSILFILFPNTSHSQCAVVSSHQAPSHRNLIWPQFPDLPYRRPKGGSYFAFLYRHFLSLKTEGPASRPLGLSAADPQACGRSAFSLFRVGRFLSDKRIVSFQELDMTTVWPLRSPGITPVLRYCPEHSDFRRTAAHG